MSPPEDAIDLDEALNLKQVAVVLGVHYMTAYRYVKQGRLAAERQGTTWRVRPEVLAQFTAQRADHPAGAGLSAEPVDWAARLVEPLVAGDERTAWQVIDAALAGGTSPTHCCTRIIGPAVATVDEELGFGPSDSYLATAVAQRLVAVLGARFRQPGRTRGTLVVGAPTGEHHALAIALLANIVRFQRYSVLELGANVPADAFAEAVVRAERCVAVGLGITRIDLLDAASAACQAIRAAAPDVPVILGGQAVRNAEVAALVGAHRWAPDAEGFVDAVEASRL